MQYYRDDIAVPKSKAEHKIYLSIDTNIFSVTWDCFWTSNGKFRGYIQS